MSEQMLAPASPAKLVVAYFDETQKLRDEGKSVVFGGCAAHDEHWTEFNQRWRGALAGTGVTTVKLSAALAFQDAFYGWKSRESERDELLFRLATVIHESPLIKVTCPMMAGDFESLPDSQRKKLKDQQYCGFEICIRAVIDHYGPADAMQINCDLTEDYAQECVRLFNILRMREPDLKRRLIGICFGEDARVPGLQAADIVAYCARAQAETERFGQVVQPIVQKIIELFGSRDDQRTYFVYRPDGAGLGYAERE